METPDTDHRPGHPSLQLLPAFLFAVALAVALCASAILRRKCRDREGHASEGRTPAGGASVKRVLLGTLRWSSSRKLGEWDSGKCVGLVSAKGRWECLAVETAAGPVSPLWQRRILMGERCELPRFSGLILYDERGFPLHANAAGASHPQQQERAAVKLVSTLRDLL